MPLEFIILISVLVGIFAGLGIAVFKQRYSAKKIKERRCPQCGQREVERAQILAAGKWYPIHPSFCLACGHIWQERWKTSQALAELIAGLILFTIFGGLAVSAQKEGNSVRFVIGCGILAACALIYSLKTFFYHFISRKASPTASVSSDETAAPLKVTTIDKMGDHLERIFSGLAPDMLNVPWCNWRHSPTLPKEALQVATANYALKADREQIVAIGGSPLKRGCLLTDRGLYTARNKKTDFTKWSDIIDQKWCFSGIVLKLRDSQEITVSCKGFAKIKPVLLQVIRHISFINKHGIKSV